MPLLKGLDKDSKAAEFLRTLTKTQDLRRPDCLVVISAHWEESVCTVHTGSRHTLYYDYGGFPPETYKIHWPVVGAPSIAQKVKKCLQDAGIKSEEETKRGLDHGVFVPLKLVFPEANIPVVQVSLLKNERMSDHLKIAEALSPLRHDNILIIGSGFATHSLGQSLEPEKWAKDVKLWLNDVLTNKNYSPSERKERLLGYKSAPGFSKAHSTLDHFLPLAMACAAAQYSPGKLLYSEFVKSLLNEHYLF
ncbi:uncharacterized protein LOC133191023 isoform X2 [Saccostrea echinata]|nr:uncharacterized protein LOC133191023 isoform X2 [Saccostrea echinata]